MKSGNWRNYQENLAGQRQKVQIRRKRFFVVLFFVSLCLFYLLCDLKSFGSGAQGKIVPVDASTEAALPSASSAKILSVLQANSREHSEDLTLDYRLQSLIQGIFERYHPPFASAVVLDAEDGSILAMVGYGASKKFLPLEATFPAASIFKIVSAAAGIEAKGLVSTTALYTLGNPYSLSPEKMRKEKFRHAQRITFADALAKSNNVAFADLTQRYLNREMLEDMALEFGFNRDIPFELPVEMSAAIFSDDAFRLAEASTGLGEHTLSPLHAAVMAAAIANGGIGYAPWIESKGKQPPFIQLSPTTAFALRTMMKKTITQGTARKSFRGYDRQGVLRLAEIGGKTGSLTSKELKGKCDWFVGFGAHSGKNIALAVVMIHHPVWHVKSSYVARKILENALADPPRLLARPT